MHYGILNSSGNVLEWFEDEASARAALEEILAESPGADLDLVAFEGPGRPAEPVSASARSGWPMARLVWSNVPAANSARNTGNLEPILTTVNDTDDKVEIETPYRHLLAQEA